MAKTALLAQNDNLAIDQLKQNVGRSSFDLSHSTTFPIDVDGAILPICAIECVPSDSFEISCECLLRQLSPLKVPLMTNIRLNTAFYYCDNRLAWKKWDRFIEGGRSGNEVYDIPRMGNVYRNDSDTPTNPTKYSLYDSTPNTSGQFANINYSNSLHTYFGISMNKSGNPLTGSYADFEDDTDELPVAFPFFDYQIICRDNYTDIDRLADTPSSPWTDYDKPYNDWSYQNLFPPDDDEIKLIDGPQSFSGFRSGDDASNPGVSYGFALDKVRYHNVRDDYFTSSKKAPMRGDAPSIGLATATAPLDFTNAVLAATDTPQIGQTISLNGNKLFYSNTQINSGSFDTKDLAINSVSPRHPEWTDAQQTNLINTLNQGVADVSVNAQITAQELRLLSQLTVWQELNMLHKPYYNDFLHAHFNGIRVGETAIETPQYIGGTSQIIHINEIQQTSATTESSALGTVGATAHSLENNYVGKYYCNSYGWIIGVAYLQVDLLYNPAMPRSFSRRTKEDYYFPEFANLSMQAILNKEIFFSNDSDWNNTAWGYTGCFDELRSIPNKVAGDLLNSSYTDLKAWVLRREFANDNLPSMSSEFLSEKDNVDKTAWAAPTMPAFMLQCANYIKAIRPMPYVAIPKAL